MKTTIEVSLDIFERMGFLLGEKADLTPADLQAPEGMLCGTVVYTGDRTGLLTVFITDALASMLAENVLGMEEGKKAVEEQRIDAFTEFLNVFCGNLLTENFGKKEVFNMSMPAVVRADKERVAAALKDPKVSLSVVEGCPVIVVFD